MLKKRINIKGLRKKVLKLEYEKKLLCQEVTGKQTYDNTTSLLQPAVKIGPSSTILNQSLNYRIIILRNAPLDESLLKLPIVDHGGQLKTEQPVRLLSKCIKKNIFKKFALISGGISCTKSLVQESKFWLSVKYVYWFAPEATSLKDQLLHLNMLKTYIRAEPKDAFLGCLLESFNSKNGVDVPFILSKDLNTQRDKKNIHYKYYYPSQILTLCEFMDKTAAKTAQKATGLEVLGHLFQTLESSIQSLSTILALKSNTPSTEDSKVQSQVESSNSK